VTDRRAGRGQVPRFPEGRHSSLSEAVANTKFPLKVEHFVLVTAQAEPDPAHDRIAPGVPGPWRLFSAMP
jgi:hypothetical protein